MNIESQNQLNIKQSNNSQGTNLKVPELDYPYFSKKWVHQNYQIWCYYDFIGLANPTISSYEAYSFLALDSKNTQPATKEYILFMFYAYQSLKNNQSLNEQQILEELFGKYTEQIRKQMKPQKLFQYFEKLLNEKFNLSILQNSQILKGNSIVNYKQKLNKLGINSQIIISKIKNKIQGELFQNYKVISSKKKQQNLKKLSFLKMDKNMIFKAHLPLPEKMHTLQDQFQNIRKANNQKKSINKFLQKKQLQSIPIQLKNETKLLISAVINQLQQLKFQNQDVNLFYKLTPLNILKNKDNFILNKQPLLLKALGLENEPTSIEQSIIFSTPQKLDLYEDRKLLIDKKNAIFWNLKMIAYELETGQHIFSQCKNQKQIKQKYHQICGIKSATNAQQNILEQISKEIELNRSYNEFFSNFINQNSNYQERCSIFFINIIDQVLTKYYELQKIQKFHDNSLCLLINSKIVLIIIEELSIFLQKLQKYKKKSQFVIHWLLLSKYKKWVDQFKETINEKQDQKNSISAKNVVKINRIKTQVQDIIQLFKENYKFLQKQDSNSFDIFFKQIIRIAKKSVQTNLQINSQIRQNKNQQSDGPDQWIKYFILEVIVQLSPTNFKLIDQNILKKMLPQSYKQPSFENHLKLQLKQLQNNDHSD